MGYNTDGTIEHTLISFQGGVDIGRHPPLRLPRVHRAARRALLMPSLRRKQRLLVGVLAAMLLGVGATSAATETFTVPGE